jgi:hypothetical protein
VERWQRTDVYGFKKRLEGAHADYVENLEVDMDDFIATSKHNTQIIRIFRLRAEAPEKYREEVKVLGVEPPIRMLEKLKELGKKELEALEAPAVEGEYREVEGPERGLQGTRPPLTPGPVPVKEVQLLTPEQAVRLYMRCALGQRANTVLAPWNRAAQAHWGTIPWTFAYC